MEGLERLKRIFERFDKDRPIDDSEYVDFDIVRGDPVLAPLRRRFELAGPGNPCAQLFGGGRGSGKTTELRRFQKSLAESGFTALYIDVENTIDVNSCGFGDYLVAIAHGVRQEVEANRVPGASRLQSYVREKVDEVRGLFGARLRLPGIDLAGPGIKAPIGLERPPSSQSSLDNELEAIASDATRGVQDMLSRIDGSVKEAAGKGLVLLVDGADKITPYPAHDAGRDHHVRIFCDRATFLTRLGCHVLYSVPLSFIYSPHAQVFSRTAGVEGPVVLPNTSLTSTGTDGKGNTVTGKDLFRVMVDRRLAPIGESVADVVEEDALERAITESGGNPDALNVIVQGAIVRMDGDLPLSTKPVEDCLRQMANSMSNQVVSDWWDLLKTLRRRQNYRDKSSEAFRLCLYHHYIYQYANGEPQFEVNPVLRRLSSMAD